MHDDKIRQNKILTPRQTDRRQNSNQTTDFPLTLPDGTTIAEDRRKNIDRRANAFIANQALFEGVPWDFIENCLPSCPVKQLQTGDILLSPQQVNEHLYLILDGQLSIHLNDPVSLAQYSMYAGDFTGDISIIDGNAPSAYVVASEPSMVIAIHRDVFWNRFSAEPTIFRNMLKMFVNRLRQSNQDALKALERQLKYQHLKKELQAAHNIQISLLPRLPLYTDYPAISAHAIMLAARDIGGDFFDALPIDESHVYFAIGDVSGKGMPAALFMTRAITLLRDAIYRGNKLESIAFNVNNALCVNNDTNMFTTVFIGILNVDNGNLRYVSGGHNPSLLGNRLQGYDYLEQPKGILMGVMEDFSYEVRQASLNPGDTLVLYTDGVTEAENIDQDFFGDETFRELLGSLPDDQPEQLVTELHEAIKSHAGTAPQSDDITVFAIHRKI